MQSQLRRRNLVDLLTSNPYRDELDITDRQAEDLRDAQKEIEADLAKEIAKLRRESPQQTDLKAQALAKNTGRRANRRCF